MTLGIYKAGQGYWVRVMTATIIAVATMALAAWLWGQTEVLATKLPVREYAITIQNAQGVPAPGQGIELFKPATRGEPSGAKIGTAVVKSFDPNSSQATVSKVEMIEGADPKDAAELRGAPAGAPFTATVASRGVNAIPLVEPLLLQGTVAAIVLLLGAILAYYYCAMKPASVEFLISTDMEMKKVNWSTRRDIQGSTFVVIAASFLLAAALFCVDYVFQWFFRVIGVLA